MKNSLAKDSGIDLEEQEEYLNESSCFSASTKNEVEKEENQRILRVEYNEMKMAGEKIYSIGRKEQQEEVHSQPCALTEGIVDREENKRKLSAKIGELKMARGKS